MGEITYVSGYPDEEEMAEARKIRTRRRSTGIKRRDVAKAVRTVVASRKCRHSVKRWVLFTDTQWVHGMRYTAWCRACGALFKLRKDKFKGRGRWVLPKP